MIGAGQEDLRTGGEWQGYAASREDLGRRPNRTL